MQTSNERSFPQLDSLDLKLIAIAKRFPGENFSAWAAHLDVSSHTVARHYERLHRHGVLRIIGRTLPGFGGRMSWLIRMQNPSPYLRTVAADFSSLDFTRWVRLSTDRRELICGLVASERGLDQLLTAAHKKLPDSTISAHHLMKVWGQPGAVPYTSAQLDKMDKDILAQLEVDGRVSNASLSRRLGADPTTISRRRKRLEDTNVLYYEADIDTRVYGDGNDANLWITMRPGKIDELGAYLKLRPEVSFVAATSGASQMVVHVALHTEGPHSPAKTVATEVGKTPEAGGVSEAEVFSSMNLMEFVDELTGWGIDHVEVVPMGTTMKRHQR